MSLTAGDHLEAWIGENLARGCTARDLLRDMTAAGIKEDDAEGLIGRVALRVAQWVPTATSPTPTPDMDVRAGHSTDRGPAFPEHLQHWVTANLLRHCEPEELAVELTLAGLDRTSAEALIDQTVKSPIFAAYDEASVRLRHLQALLGARRELDRLARPAPRVERRAGLGREEFLADYYSANRPVVMTDVTESWDALNWTWPYLASVLRDVPVEVMAERADDPDWHLHPEGTPTTVAFDDYIARILEGGASNERYIVANNRLFRNPAAQILFADFPPDERYLQSPHEPERTHMWCGPAGTITHLHFDIPNLLLVQVLGRKVVKLVPALDFDLMDPVVIAGRASVFSALRDLDTAGRANSHQLGELRPITLVMEPGEALFIPLGWWHQVKALEPSISISFTGFVFPNAFLNSDVGWL